MSYPPREHYLSDLSLRILLEGDRSEASVAVTPQVCGPSGSVRLGVLATVIDMCAGGLAGSKAAPDWVATSDMSIHVVEPIRPGSCSVDCRLVRRGRFLVVLDQDLRAVAAGEDRLCGRATAAFSVLPSRGVTQGGGPRKYGVRELAAGPRAELDLLRRLCVVEIDAGRGELEMELSNYVRNTFDALQGGAVAVLAEAAMEASCGRSLQHLEVRFLAQGREGPFRTEVRRLRGEVGEVLRCAIRDLGSEGRLVATAYGRPLPD